MNIESKFGIPTQIAQEFGISKNYKRKSIDLNLDEEGRVGFIENKHYNFERISQLLELSTKCNHHANGGPISRLLETAVLEIIRTENFKDRCTIAVCNGTAALQLACSANEILTNIENFRWVASNFNFFSAKMANLSNTILIDSNITGGFDLNALKSIPIEQYDGVIYTNIFANNSDWTEVQAFCKKHNKKLVIDNATGLFDRPKYTDDNDPPIEIVSAHHTKPWGVGEGGFVLCSAEQGEIIRKLLNFGVQLKPDNRRHSSNYKISDISAAAIFVRLEELQAWAPYYYEAQDRLISLVDQFIDFAKPLQGNSGCASPRAHTPFVSTSEVNQIADKSDKIVTRKYYQPLDSQCNKTNAHNLYDKIFCLPNCPALTALSDDEIIAQIKKFKKI